MRSSTKYLIPSTGTGMSETTLRLSSQRTATFEIKNITAARSLINNCSDFPQKLMQHRSHYQEERFMISYVSTAESRSSGDYTFVDAVLPDHRASVPPFLILIPNIAVNSLFLKGESSKAICIIGGADTVL